MKLTIAIIMVALIGLCSCCYYLPEWSTQYSTPAVKKNFTSVRLGTTLDELYVILGKPFYAAVIYNGTNAPVENDYEVSADHLRNRMKSGDVTLWLQYSKNNGRSGYYNRYELEMRNGVVIRVNQDLQD